ncbi:MAG: S-methyl-5'-thioinosine phosphorylase [Gammaproteobacteria bacterium]
MSLLAIIGGTGLSDLAGLTISRRQEVATPWGEPSAPVSLGRMAGREAVFLPRHGSGHTIAPHRVNYRANIWALREVGATEIVAVNAVGGIREDLVPGGLCVPDQIVDYTFGRGHTFFEGRGQPVRHVDFTEPYSAATRARLLAAGRQAGVDIVDGGTYGATQGPRLETAAEIARMARDGCHMVGMTGMPEAALARELEVAYACCAVVVNRAAGLGDDILGELDRYLDLGMRAVRAMLDRLLSEEETE